MMATYDLVHDQVWYSCLTSLPKWQRVISEMLLGNCESNSQSLWNIHSWVAEEIGLQGLPLHKESLWGEQAVSDMIHRSNLSSDYTNEEWAWSTIYSSWLCNVFIYLYLSFFADTAVSWRLGVVATKKVTWCKTNGAHPLTVLISVHNKHHSLY